LELKISNYTFILTQYPNSFAQISIGNKGRCSLHHSFSASVYSRRDRGGKKDLYTLLERIDLSQFNIREVPKTAALEQQKLESLTGLDSWLYELLQDEGRWVG
jgi:hypothetical protein